MTPVTEMNTMTDFKIVFCAFMLDIPANEGWDNVL